MISNGQLHYAIIKHIVDHGYAPDTDALSAIFGVTHNEIVTALNNLQEYHGVVLHPGESKIWVIHPFSLAPTNFLVRSNNGLWWGNCAWCSLGIAALLKE